jgi:hypothetical protein
VARASVRLSITARDVCSLDLLYFASIPFKFTVELAMADTAELANVPANKRPHSAVDGDENGELRALSSSATLRGLLTLLLDRQ